MAIGPRIVASGGFDTLYREGMGLIESGVKVSDRGFVEVDTATMATTRPDVYAIGDCVNTPGLAHVAYAEAVVAVQAILGENPAPVDYAKVPWVVYTHPEVAWAGVTLARSAGSGSEKACFASCGFFSIMNA